MYFEEYLERLKQQFPMADFSIPYLAGTTILRKIEKNFIKVKDLREDYHLLAQYCSHWADNMKNKVALRTVQLYPSDGWLAHLDPGVNYWTVLARRQQPMVKHSIFDTKPNAMRHLVSRHQDDFFIADKRYAWLVYFEVEVQKNTAFIHKSGDAPTPFDV
jgi:hypothetical protein